MSRDACSAGAVVNPRLLSRREFLPAAAAGLVACARGSQAVLPRAGSNPNDDLLYVGTYTEGTRSDGIYLLRMDLRSGQLSQIGSTAAANPSFLTIHPNGRTLYAVNELETYKGTQAGAVSAFAIAGDTGGLTQLNEQASGGSAPCYVSVDRSGSVVLVANYLGGNVAVLPIQADGSLAAATQVVKHNGTGPHQNQAAPHAHYILADPSNRFVLAADLGADRVFVYRLDLTAKLLRHVEGGDGVMRPGAGPRHLDFHPTLPLVFVANELDSTVATLRFDGDRGVLTPLDVRSTLPPGWSGTNYVADIHIAPDGRALYVSNRGHHSIAVLSVTASGALALQQVVSTEGDWPRNFSLDPTGRWLLVANQRSDSIVVFARDPLSGRLTPTQRRIALPSPVCLRFRRHARG